MRPREASNRRARLEVAGDRMWYLNRVDRPLRGGRVAAWRVGGEIREGGGGSQLPHVAKIKTCQHEREHVAAQTHGRKGTRVLAPWDCHRP